MYILENIFFVVYKGLRPVILLSHDVIMYVSVVLNVSNRKYSRKNPFSNLFNVI